VSLMVAVQLCCDEQGCYAAFEADSPDVGSARDQRRMARGAGWRVATPGGLDFCPRHADKRRRSAREPGNPYPDNANAVQAATDPERAS
jgi:hypothetical protein